MKKFMKKMIYGIAWFFSWIFNGAVLRAFGKFASCINTANFRRALKKHGKDTAIGRRNHFEHLKYVSVGDHFSAGDGLWIGAYPRWGGEEYQPSVEIGDGVSFSRNCHVGAIGKIRIGDHVLIGSNVLIHDHAHGASVATDKPRAELPLVTKGGIEIGDNTWVGENVCILGGVTIGKNCIIGANSVVTKSFDGDGLLIAGNPAKIVRIMPRADE